jgi:DNA-binding NarL/FixJ family response regulator
MHDERRRALAWEDEVAFVPADSAAFRVWHRPHADDWEHDLQQVQPHVVLLDNDMGAEHRQGWEVLVELRRTHPDLVVFSISRHPAAALRMTFSGALVAAKEDAGRLLQELAARWPELLDERGRLSRERCATLEVCRWRT